jgi:nitrite reductase/ring-hydroxylating ferredoxin subunit
MEELKTISPAPAAPAAPDPCAEHHHRPAPPLSSRRAWMFKLGIAFNAVAGILIGVPILGYVLSGIFGKKNESAWINLGPIGGFPEDQTRLATYKNPFTQPWDGQTGNVPCWVRHIEGEKFQVFAINCTHLGCPIRWFQESRLFMCPCHGGVFYEDGQRASGPPPRGLYVYQHKVENGQLMIYGGHLPTLAKPA